MALDMAGGVVADGGVWWDVGDLWAMVWHVDGGRGRERVRGDLLGREQKRAGFSGI
jgi:hypothetical protein